MSMVRIVPLILSRPISTGATVMLSSQTGTMATAFRVNRSGPAQRSRTSRPSGSITRGWQVTPSSSRSKWGSDWINGRTGIFIDDVVVRALKVGCGTCAEVSGVQPPEDLLRSGLGSINPNPFSNRATVAYTVTDAGPVKLQVFDLTGRLIRTLKSGQGDTNSGVHRSSWDGMDENGARVPNGIYFVRLKIGEQSWNRRAILIR